MTSRLCCCPQSNTERPLRAPRRCDSTAPPEIGIEASLNRRCGSRTLVYCIDSPVDPPVSSHASPVDPPFRRVAELRLLPAPFGKAVSGRFELCFARFARSGVGSLEPLTPRVFVVSCPKSPGPPGEVAFIDCETYPRPETRRTGNPTGAVKREVRIRPDEADIPAQSNQAPPQARLS